MVLPYQRAGLTLANGQANDATLVRALQHDLRQLGYLRRGIDGAFGDGTVRAIRALRYDLIHNGGTGKDGKAPVAVTSYNRGRLTAPITDVLDQNLAGCIADMLGTRIFHHCRIPRPLPAIMREQLPQSPLRTPLWRQPHSCWPS